MWNCGAFVTERCYGAHHMSETDDLDGTYRPAPSPSDPFPDPRFGPAGQPWSDPSAQAGPYGQPGAYGQLSAYGQPGAYGQAGYWPAVAYAQSVPPGYGPSSGGNLADDPAPILVKFAPPTQQRRVTVLFRSIITIPHLVALSALSVALWVVSFIGWFVALFTGELPPWAHTFITGVVRWQARVYAYLFLLTDAYPPFSLEDDDYPVRLVTRQTKLSWAAVLFRILVAIPAALAAELGRYGLAVLSLFGWLVTLVTGELPPSLHQAGAAIVRYSARYYGFFFLLTDEYPKALYGDSGAPDRSAEPGLGAESGVEAGQRSGATDAGWQLALSGAAKALVTVALVLGAAVAVGYVILIARLPRPAADNPANQYALSQVAQANSVLGKSITNFPTAVQACGGQLTCVTALDLKLGNSLATFAGAVEALRLSGAAAAAAADVVSYASAAGQDLSKLGSATSVAQYQDYAGHSTLQQDLNHLSASYAHLIADLGAS
jgi:hypothetical protein